MDRKFQRRHVNHCNPFWCPKAKLVSPSFLRAQLHPQLEIESEAASHTFELHTFLFHRVTCHVCHKLLKGLLDQVCNLYLLTFMFT